VIVEFIQNCAEKRVAGVVVNTGRYIPRVPDEAVRAADALKLPLMITPWETRLVEFTKDICIAIIDQSIENESTNTLADNLSSGQDPLRRIRVSACKIRFEDARLSVTVFALETFRAARGGPCGGARPTPIWSATAYGREPNGRSRRALETMCPITKARGDRKRLREFLLSVAEIMQWRHPGYRLLDRSGKPCQTVPKIPRLSYRAAVLRARRFDELGSVVFLKTSTSNLSAIETFMFSLLLSRSFFRAA
jgi:hypothetical protein